jgi:hypothetical protein
MEMYISKHAVDALNQGMHWLESVWDSRRSHSHQAW